ncbi:hypothetical protein H9P43_008030 [Blastocladiella emersonii ATCC 22665]|nr:hypothetical protein H9P43_008030 [Blastocladiella emersonii ATCC 22665]
MMTSHASHQHPHQHAPGAACSCTLGGAAQATGESLDEVEFARSLHGACAAGDADRVAKALLRDLLAVHRADAYGNQPLHYAARQGHVGIVRTLLDAGADVNAVTAGGSRTTPLHRAVLARSAPTVRVLLATRGIRLDVCDEDGLTPLDYAMLDACLARVAPDRRAMLICRERSIVNCAVQLWPEVELADDPTLSQIEIRYVPSLEHLAALIASEPMDDLAAVAIHDIAIYAMRDSAPGVYQPDAVHRILSMLAMLGPRTLLVGATVGLPEALFSAIETHVPFVSFIRAEATAAATTVETKPSERYLG